MISSAASLSSKDRLRRIQSARSMRRIPQVPPPEPFDPGLAKSQAAAAASRAMRRSTERSSIDSQRSYERLGGPGSLAVPRRRRPSSTISCSEDGMVDGSSRPVSTFDMYDNDQTASAVLPPISEFGGLDGRDFSAPSSYRRLRKAKSMFSTRQRTKLAPAVSSESYHTPYSNSAAESSRPHGSLRRSMSFLRGTTQPSRSVRHAKSQEASIQLARSQFMQSPNSPLSQGQSPLYNVKTRREHKPFRKTFRTTSESYDATNSSYSEDQPKSGGLHGKARSFSSSIKKGLKRVFGITRPHEQTESQEMSEYSHSPAESGKDTEYTPDTKYPSKPVNLDFSSRPRTIRSSQSTESLATSRSRVTSWADSTAANTITARRPERNPLSIIQEHSTLTGTPDDSFRPGPLRPDGSIDTQRLYSALIKRIGRDAIENPDEEITIGHVAEHRPIPERGSSLYSRRTRQSVRHVTSNDSMASPRSFATANGGGFSPPKSQLSKRNLQKSKSFHHDNANYLRPASREYAPSLYGKDSDDDSGSVIVSKSTDTVNSPSVYSRTTSGNSPVKNRQASGDSVEPGMVTIYASQRTAYKSPKRMTDPSPREPSADWQQWMNSEIARIEALEPTRQHYRESTETCDDVPLRLPPTGEIQETARASMLPLNEFHGPLEKRECSGENIGVQSNFSRPFSRSPSVRTILAPQKVHGGARLPSSSPVFPTPTKDSDGQNIPMPRMHDDSLSPSPMRSRSSNMLQAQESPTPKREQRKMTDAQYRRYSARRLPATGDARFRTVRGRQSSRMVNNENMPIGDGYGDNMLDHNRLQDIHSTISSKRMVEMFLDSRRQQTEGLSENAFI